jgi:hypothetical protein
MPPNPGGCQEGAEIMQTQVIPQSVENLGILAEDFARHLRAENTSPKTIKTYLEAVRGLDGFLAEAGISRP